MSIKAYNYFKQKIRHGEKLERYGKEEKTKMLEKVRKNQLLAHQKARQLLVDMGFEVVEDNVISNKPWDFIAKKHGLTYYIDSKSPFTKNGTFKITESEIQGMLKLRQSGIPAYLLILPDGRSVFLVEQ